MPFAIVKLMILPFAAILVAAPFATCDLSAQARVEHIVSQFLASKGTYMGLYFSDVDTAFASVEEEAAYKELNQKVLRYQDSTMMFSRIDVNRANAYFEIYKNLNLEKDSMRIHYKPRPLGYFVIHHFQFDGDPWTDSFIVDFNFNSIIKIKRTIE